MKINILTIFPEIFTGWMESGIMRKAIEDNKLEINIIDFREYSENKHKKVDDYPFGGKEGMLLMPQPIFSAIKSNNLENTYTIFPSPRGRNLTQEKIVDLAQFDEITLLAGRYEGVDQRVIDTFVDEEISIGDYIITGGELAIQVIIDGVVRLLPGVLNNNLSFENESFSNDLLEHPQYTRPSEYEGQSVPEVLLNGHHQKQEEWMEYEQLKITYKKRPDLLEKKELTNTENEILKKIIEEENGKKLL